MMITHWTLQEIIMKDSMVKVQLEIDQCMQTILATKTMEANLQLDQEELKTITLTTLEPTSPWITATSKASTPWKNKTKITKSNSTDSNLPEMMKPSNLSCTKPNWKNFIKESPKPNSPTKSKNKSPPNDKEPWNMKLK
jgi:hypothetical protein